MEVFMIPVSVCMIAKNEETYIGECLKRLSAYDWEIILVDTGSTDRTVEIARQYTPHIHHFDWCGDFSAARNYSISKASHDTILVVDCDEYLEADAHTETTLRSLPTLLKGCQLGTYILKNPILSSDPSVDSMADRKETGSDTSTEALITANEEISQKVPEEVAIEKISRIFLKEHIHYEGKIHEQLAPLQPALPLSFVSVPLTFYHHGYSSKDIRKNKAARNITLLMEALTANGPDPYLYFQLGQSYFGLAEYAQALPYFEQALAMDVNEQEDYVQILIESYGYTLLALKQYQKALGLEGVASVFSKQADFVFLMGLIYMNNGLFDEAVQSFLKATTIPAYSVEGTNSYKAFYNAGVICECAGDQEQALQFYQKCPAYAPALEGIARLQ